MNSSEPSARTGHPFQLPAWDWSAAARDAAEQGDDRPTWAYDWPAGQRLARDLPDLVDLRGRSVIDLGCGRGQLGFAALAAGVASVVFCDGNPAVLAFVAAVLKENGLCERAATKVHRWGESLPPADLVLGGDILYRPECFAALVASLATCGPDTDMLLADPREQIEPAFAALLAEAGLEMACERREHQAPYTLLRVTR